MREIDRIKEQFCEVIRYSQSIPDPQVDALFHDWELAKEKFIERFGGLIYEWPEPIEFTLDEKEKRCRAADFANQVYDTFNNPVLAEFIDENLDGFFENKVVKVCEGSDIPKGMKLLKAFKYFEHNPTTLRNIQDAASLLIQENKIKGKLCFSVHPLDFLSSSENTYNWRSCHALDGEYRAGNLSYMTDRTTFMVYLKGMDEAELPNFGPVKWNSKKWRMLIHEHEDSTIMFAGRQYPFSSKSGIDTVLNIYNNLIQQEHPFGYYKYFNWKDDYIDSYVPHDADPNDNPRSLNCQYAIINGFLAPLQDIVVEGRYARNYNDILRSTCYHYPYYAIFNNILSRGGVKKLVENPIVIGGSVPCLHCGKDWVDNSETMRCDDCELAYGVEENENYTHCACCGRRMYVDDAYVAGDNEELICQQCYDTECFRCDECDYIYYNSDKIYCEETETYLCPHCYENRNEGGRSYR